MFQSVLFIKLLLVHYGTQSPAETNVNCRDEVRLQCPGFDPDKMDFLSLTWYKITSEGKRGIVRRSKGDETPQYYNFKRSAKFGDIQKFSLLLPDVTPEDSGTYECAISANVGGRNEDLQVHLTVNECVTEAAPTTVMSSTSWTPSEQPCHKQAEDLPVIWSVVGYVVVALSKVIFSLICIWVIRALKTRSSRRRQRKW